MALIKEDGTSRTDANTYALEADGNAYAALRLYATAWTGASTPNREAALAMATRLIDSEFQYNGFKSNAAQSLQWPRRLCPDPDSDQLGVAIGYGQIGAYLAENLVPKLVLDATCEMAIRLLESNRTADPDGQGIKSVEIAGAVAVEFSKSDIPPTVPREIVNALAKYGQDLGGGSRQLKVVRT